MFRLLLLKRSSWWRKRTGDGRSYRVNFNTVRHAECGVDGDNVASKMRVSSGRSPLRGADTSSLIHTVQKTVVVPQMRKIDKVVEVPAVLSTGRASRLTLPPTCASQQHSRMEIVSNGQENRRRCGVPIASRCGSGVIFLPLPVSLTG